MVVEESSSASDKERRGWRGGEKGSGERRREMISEAVMLLEVEVEGSGAGMEGEERWNAVRGL